MIYLCIKVLSRVMLYSIPQPRLSQNTQKCAANYATLLKRVSVGNGWVATSIYADTISPLTTLGAL
jgi:hypothetical protein